MGYTLALFIHILGALGLFFLVGVELLLLARLRQARATAQVRELLATGRAIERLHPPVTLAILGAGLYLTAAAWGWRVAWIDCALALTLALALLGALLGARRAAALCRAVDTQGDGPVGAALAAAIRDPAFATVSQTMGALALGIVFLMTAKPDWGGSLATVGAALALGVASAVPLWRSTPGHLPVSAGVAGTGDVPGDD